MTDYDYGYWIMRQGGSPVATIRSAVLIEAKAGRFTRFGAGVRDACSNGIADTKAERAFIDGYHAAQEHQRQIAGVA